MAAFLRLTSVLAIVALLTTSGCRDLTNEPVRRDMASLSRLSDAQWQDLSARTIYFGHQSVGENIIEGLRDVAAGEPRMRLKISPTRSDVSGTLNEFPIGENGEPDSKNAAFLAAVHGPLGPKPVLLFKYCYVDVDLNADVQKLFRDYQNTVAKLRASHPDAIIVHVTVPLSTDSYIRNQINSFRGRPTRIDRNAVRARYNDLLRAAYRDREPIYDLAAIEATHADGTRSHATSGGTSVYALVPEWASDEGHLNAAGRRRAAEELLVTLASLPANVAPPSLQGE